MSLRKDKSSEKNKALMRLALELANQNKGLTGLNPSVGCVVTHKDEIISYGKTYINGRPHAEAAALKNNKINFKNSNIYVTLEPCIHYGKTPPCTNIIIKKKIKLVNYSIEDFDKRTAKKTKRVLKKNNILAKIGLIKNEVNHFYKDYKFSKFNGIPYV
ncbi:deaminase, partial [Candidatus Pelagibacter sp.]|nr:deaminase [Candidatus Pelagibacter sp.]